MQPDTLQVVITDLIQLEADKVDLFFQVSGASWVNGRAALTQAREVSKLVADLITAGVAEKDIELLNVRAEVSSGMLGKSSSAHYSLKARCHQVEKLDELLAVATAPKQVVLESLRWGYPHDEEADLQRTEAGLARALNRGRRMAAALELKLTGVHSVTETLVDNEQGQVRLQLDYSSLSRSRYQADLGVEVRHCKEVIHTLTVLFTVKASELIP
ncbi:MAG: SIMPL domain-containing protein [Candidatus Eremiobacteraeota bacterium]|nr:SIMPL domain-containing protein [Candidatus Eremiobacteraeota bacterium]MCW5870135.1 SIMPL domain-containing protein [Candidatus Eremiobacteraeota bacterium]